MVDGMDWYDEHSLILDGKLLCTGRGQRRPCVQLLPRQPPALQRQVVQGIAVIILEY